MTIKIDRARESALTMAVADELGRAGVLYNHFVKLCPQTELKNEEELLSEEAAEKLYRYCGEPGLAGFVTCELGNVLRTEYDIDTKSKERPLPSIKEFANVLELAKRLVSSLKKLPYRYRLTVQLPIEVSAPLLPFVNAVKMSEDAVICTAAKLPRDFPLTNDNVRVDAELFSDWLGNRFNTSRDLSEERLYFTTTDVGYADRSSTAPVLAHFHDRLRAIYGACLALGFFNSEYGFKTEKKPLVVVHEMDETTRIIGRLSPLHT